MRVRPTRATVASLATSIVLYLLAYATGSGWLALGAAAALALPVTSFAVYPPFGRLRIELRGPDRVVVGAVLEQVLVVTNAGRRSTPRAMWREHVRGLEPFAVDMPALLPGEKVELCLSRRAVQRGVYDQAWVRLSTTAPFGTLAWEKDFPALRPLWVHPATDRGRPLRPGGAERSEVRSVTVAGAGTEVLGVRPWRPGDPARAVSARATARHGRPVVLERERENDTGSALVVLAGGGSSGPTWESNVSYVASVTLAALREGRRVTLIAGSGGPTVPRTLDATSVLDFFAGIDKAGKIETDVARAAARTVHPGGTMLFLRGANSQLQIRTDGAATCCHREVLDA